MSITFNLDIENYIYQDGGDGEEIIIFASDEKLQEHQQFEFAAYHDTYNRVKDYLSKSVKMQGTDWNDEYKIFESLTFYDAEGESTTIPINAAKLGVSTTLEKEELDTLLKFINDIEKEDKEYRDKPIPPVTLNIIDSNGMSQTVVAQPMRNLGEPNLNGRIYPSEVVQQALEKFKSSDPPNFDGAPISDSMNTCGAPVFINGSWTIEKSEMKVVSEELKATIMHAEPTITAQMGVLSSHINGKG